MGGGGLDISISDYSILSKMHSKVALQWHRKIDNWEAYSCIRVVGKLILYKSIVFKVSGM